MDETPADISRLRTFSEKIENPKAGDLRDDAAKKKKGGRV